MFEYTISTQQNEEIFEKQCTALLKNIEGIIKGKLYTDVDKTKIQEFFYNGKRLTVHNSIYLDEIIIKSEFDIAPFFIDKRNQY